MPSKEIETDEDLNRVRKFCAESPDSGRLALAMALTGRMESATTWANTLRKFQIYEDSARMFTGVKVNTCLKNLESEGFVSKNRETGRNLDSSWVMPFLKVWFEKDSASFRTKIPLTIKSYEENYEIHKWKVHPPEKIGPARRSLILTFLCAGMVKEAESFIRLRSKDKHFEDMLHPVAHDIALEQFSEFSPGIRSTLENIRAVACLHWLSDPEELIGYIRENAADDMSLRMLAELQVVSGEFEEAEKTAAKLVALGTAKGISNGAAISAWIAFLQGKDDAAIEGYHAAVGALLKGTRKKKGYPGGLASPFLLLAMLRRGGAEDVAHFQTHLGWGIELDKGYHNIYLNPLEMLDAIRIDTESKRAAEIVAVAIRNALQERSGGLNSMLGILVAYWTVPEALDPHEAKILDRLRDIVKAATDGGYRWIAKEVSELVAAISNDATVSEKAAKFAEKLGRDLPDTVPLVGLMKPAPLWEKSLASLESYLSSKDGSARKNDQLMIWGVGNDRYGEFLGIQPFERRRLKSGKWSKPRKVALKTMLTSYRDWNHLGEADRKLAGLIRDDYDLGWRFGNSGLIIDFESALPHLAGHPHVYLAAHDQIDLSRPLAVVETCPTVTLSETGDGGMRIAINPSDTDLEAGEWIYGLSDTDELNYCRIPESLIRLLKAFPSEKSRTIPAQARDRVSSVVSRMSGDILVQGDEAVLEGSDVRKVDSDGTIRLRLTPSGDGLLVKSLVFPLGDKGSPFVPGAGNESVFGRDDEGPIRTTRDLAAERLGMEKIIEHSQVLSVSPDGDAFVWTLPGMMESLELLLSVREMPEEIRPELEWPEGEKFTLKALADTDSFSLRLKSTTNWLEASGELEIDESNVLTMQSLLRLMAESGSSRFIRLEDGQFLALTEKLRKHLADIGALAQKAELKDGEAYRLPEVSGHLLEDFAEEAKTKSNPAWKRRIAQLEEAHQMDFPVPKTLQASLRPYQEEGFRWLARLAHWTGGACLADDMGLGKTVQALGFLLHRAADGPALIVAPTSVAANWADEALRFAPTLNVRVFRGPGRDAMLKDLGPRDMVIVTYGLLQSESEAFAKLHWSTVVIDEAQAIKNRTTLRYKAAIGLDADFRLITTGTPVENRLDELYNLFHFIQPGLLGGVKFFKDRFANPIEQQKDEQTRDRLRRAIHPFLLRRLKSDVLRDLPEKTEITLQVELSKEETAFYEALRRNAVENIEADVDEKGAVKILAELMRLRRACCNPSLIDPETAPPSSKLAVFRDTLGEILSGGHRVLVFSQFVDHLAILKETLEEEEISYQYLDGSTTPKQRKDRIDAFQSGEGEVFLISLKAGGFGLNLTAADYVIHMDPWWNPAVEDQASDRAHRIGQTRPVTIYRLVTTGTIEEKIVELHRQKRDLAESLLTGSDTASRLNAAQLKALLTEG